METISVSAASKTYPVFIGKNIIESLPDFIVKQYEKIGKILIITDEAVAALHLPAVKNVLEKTGKTVIEYITPEGEHAKTFQVFYDTHSYALSQNLNRNSMVLALGGGAVGDLAGFVAATFMRGVPFLQIPTTLLAHDSAVGGKVAINHPEGKNMIGVFYQPEAVFYDINFLRTLPARELRSGFAEIVKEALIQDPAFYSWLLENIKDLQALSENHLLHMIKKGIEIKAAIVSEDERETGVRAYLNLGHTLGHAVETMMGYGEFPHGEAVMVGLVYALRLSMKECSLDFDMEKFTGWVQSLGYNIQIKEDLDCDGLISLMKKDKKSVGSMVTFVLLKEIGAPITTEIADHDIKDVLRLMYL
ncbi:3-dehydroquinate synthase [Peribacillus sp. SCS-155]|uniref:3-dehydroquinate synthase n=1 Tax=Peribacillus sedimenti TaxID=3115297 RepID=UPI003905D21B